MRSGAKWPQIRSGFRKLHPVCICGPFGPLQKVQHKLRLCCLFLSILDHTPDPRKVEPAHSSPRVATATLSAPPRQHHRARGERGRHDRGTRQERRTRRPCPTGARAHRPAQERTRPRGHRIKYTPGPPPNPVPPPSPRNCSTTLRTFVLVLSAMVLACGTAPHKNGALSPKDHVPSASPSLPALRFSCLSLPSCARCPSEAPPPLALVEARS